MKKRNVFIQTAVASALLAFGVAHAGSVTVSARSVANEAFGTAVAQPTIAAGAISLPTLQYTFNTPGGIVVNNSGSVKVVFTLAGGTTDTAGTFNAANVILTSGINTFTPTVSSTGSAYTVTLTNNSGGNLTIGIGASVSLVSTAANAQYRVIGVTKGTNVAVTGQALNGLDNSVLEATTAAANAITFAEAVTAASTVSTSANKINLNTLPTPGTALVAAAPVSFGGVTLTNTAGTQVKLDAAGATDTDLTDATTTAYAQSGTFTVGKVSGAFTPGMTVGLYTTQACTTAITGTLTQTNAPVGAIAAGTTRITLAYTGLVAAQLDAGVFVCGDYSVVTAGTVLSEITPTVAFTYDKASTSYMDEVVASFNGYALTTNGQTKIVRSYIPAAAVGYTSFVRVINTGAVDAPVTGQFVNEDGSTPSAAGVIIATLKAGGSKTLTSSEIETAMGVAPAGATRPRLRLTAATNGLEAQSFFLTNANGNFSDATGAQ